MEKKFRTQKYRNSIAVIPKNLKKGEYSDYVLNYTHKGQILAIAFIRLNFIIHPHQKKRETISSIANRLGISRRIVSQCIKQYDPDREIDSLLPKNKGPLKRFTDEFIVELKEILKLKNKSQRQYNVFKRSTEFKKLCIKYEIKSISKSKFYSLLKE